MALIVIDTSAVVAILFEEEDQLRYAEAIEVATTRLVSAVTRVELSFVIEGRKREAGRERLERFFALTGAEIVAVTPQQATIAIGAFRKLRQGTASGRAEYRRLLCLRACEHDRPPVAFQGERFRAHGHTIGPDMTSSIRKKLIEVSIPLEAINKASVREKSIRHGHPSTLHLWRAPFGTRWGSWTRSSAPTPSTRRPGNTPS